MVFATPNMSPSRNAEKNDDSNKSSPNRATLKTNEDDHGFKEILNSAYSFSEESNQS